MKSLFFNAKSNHTNFLTVFFSMLFMPFINAMMLYEGEGGANPEETIKEAIEKETKALKESLKVFKKSEDIDKEIAALEKRIEDANLTELKGELDALRKAGEEFGIELKKLREQKTAQTKKSLEDILAEKAEGLKEMVTDKNKGVQAAITKDVLTANTTNDRPYYSEPGVREIQRGIPWIRSLFNVVTLGPDTHGSIDWWEQLAVTNNASMVAEGSASGTQSNLTWVRKTLDDKIINDHIKVSKDRLKDVAFVAGEVRTLVERNMRLKENEQILKGDGLTNNIKGIIEYAQTFATAGISIRDANLNDLVGKIVTQIRKNSLDGFMPNAHCANSELLDLVRFAKDEFGNYIFPNWAQGAPVSMQGLMSAENNLIDDNTLLVGDFTLGTIYEWDSLMIEVGYVDKDFINGMVTINARMRENLRIKDNDVEGFVYVSDVDTAIANITEVAG